MSGNKLIIDAVYNPITEDGFLQVGINDGENSANINSNGSLNVNNFDSFSLLGHVLKELKIMNLHLSLLTDNVINHSDVE